MWLWPHALRQTPAQHLVLCFEEFKLCGHLTVGGSGDKKQKRVVEPAHGGNMRASMVNIGKTQTFCTPYKNAFARGFRVALARRK
jgi:hypothetical protein